MSGGVWVGRGGWVAIVSQRGCHNYVLRQNTQGENKNEESGHVCLCAAVPSQERLLALRLAAQSYSQEDYIMAPGT